jgi:hypothetical protein
MDYFNTEKLNAGFTEMEFNGIKFLAARTPDNEMRIERLLSTNPLHFLDPRFQPGLTIPKKEI